MLGLSLPLEIWLCIEPTDMRCGYDRLAQRAHEHARRDVLAGGLFVFFNRRRDRVKLLYYYPERGFGGSLERVGDWAYLHE